MYFVKYISKRCKKIDDSTKKLFNFDKMWKIWVNLFISWKNERNFVIWKTFDYLIKIFWIKWKLAIILNLLKNRVKFIKVVKMNDILEECEKIYNKTNILEKGKFCEEIEILWNVSNLKRW